MLAKCQEIAVPEANSKQEREKMICHNKSNEVMKVSGFFKQTKHYKIIVLLIYNAQR